MSRNPLKSDLPQKYSPWVITIIVVFFFSYWIFVTLGIRDLSWATDPPDWWINSIRPRFNLPLIERQILFVIQFFSPLVLMYLIPIFVGYWMVYSTTLIVLQNLYDLPNKEAAKQLLTRLQSSASRQIAQPITPDTLETDKGKGTLLSVGGPGRIRIKSHHVVITEMNGEIHRVFSTENNKSTRNLLMFEQIKAVLDLQAQERDIENVSLLTKDGISIICDLGITFCIDRGGELPTREKPYPYDEQAVRKAAYAGTILNGKQKIWSELPLGMAIGQLKKGLLKFTLDNLIDPENSDMPTPRINIKDTLEIDVKNAARHIGIEILGVRLGSFTIEDSTMTEQHIEFWRTKWEQKRKNEEARGKATAEETVEKVRSKANMDMIRSLIEGIEKISNNEQEYGENFNGHLLAMRMLESMQTAARRSSDVVIEQKTNEGELPVVLDADGQASVDLVEQARAEMQAQGK